MSLTLGQTSFSTPTHLPSASETPFLPPPSPLTPPCLQMPCRVLSNPHPSITALYVALSTPPPCPCPPLPLLRLHSSTRAPLTTLKWTSLAAASTTCSQPPQPHAYEPSSLQIVKFVLLTISLSFKWYPSHSKDHHHQSQGGPALKLKEKKKDLLLKLWGFPQN